MSLPQRLRTSGFTTLLAPFTLLLVIERRPSRKRPALLLYTATVCFLFTTGWHLASAQETQQKPGVEPAAKPAEKADKPEQPAHPAQIELLETKVRFETNGDSRKEVHALVKINSELGVRQFAQLNFDFNRSFETVEIPMVHITHANGGTSDILPSAVTDHPNPAVVNAPAYQDVRVKSVRILGLQPGDTLEYRVVRTVSRHPLAPDFWLEHFFDRSGVVSHEIFELDLPGHPQPVTNRHKLNIDWIATPPAALFTGVPLTSEEHVGSANDERSSFLWDLKSAPPLSESGSENSQGADIVASTFHGWASLAERLKSQSPKWSEDDWVAMTSRIASETASANTPEDKLRAAYEMLSRDIRTIDVPLAVSGFRIRNRKEILTSGYATPLEKCDLLAAIANRLGFKAETALYGAPNLQEEYARLEDFSHSFVLGVINQQFVTLDPSLEVAPFGLVSAKFRGQPLLSLVPFALGDTTRVWITPPPFLPFPPRQNVRIDSVINALGTLSAHATYTMRGDNELVLRVAFHRAPKERWKEVAQLLSLTDGFRGQVTSVNASDPYATKEPFTVEYELDQPKFVDWSKKPVRIPALLPQIGLPDAPAKPASSSATAPIDLGTPLEVVTKMTLHLPPGTTGSAPAGTTVERDYATYSSQYAVNGSTLTATRRIKFVLREVPAGRAADYNAFLRAVQNDEAQDFTLERQTSSSLPPSKP